MLNVIVTLGGGGLGHEVIVLMVLHSDVCWCGIEVHHLHVDVVC